ncbi:MAG: hypothetical protein WDN10_03585 [bacterium]
MSYSQRPLIEAFKRGEVPGESTVPKHIETVISNVFLFPERVYKVYKDDNEFFNKNFRDISAKEARFSFTRKDFVWNSTLSPSIYLELKGAAVAGASMQLAEPGDSAEELVFLMNRIDSKDILFEKLSRGEVSVADAYAIGGQLAGNLAKVRTRAITGLNYFEIFEREIRDVREWIQGVSEYIPEEEWKKYCDFMEEFRQTNRAWHEGELSEQLAYSGDAHSHNAVFSNGALYLMDTYAPKEEWMVAHNLIPFYRIGADLWALGSKELFDSYARGYEAALETTLDPRLQAPFIIYAASIMVSYLYMLQKTDTDKKEAAKKYHEFIQRYYKEITNPDAQITV